MNELRRLLPRACRALICAVLASASPALAQDRSVSVTGTALTWTLTNFKPTDDIEITFRPTASEAAATAAK